MAKGKEGINAVVEKKLGDGITIHSISWVATEDCGPFAGKQLTGGHPTVKKGVKIVEFREEYKRQPALIKYENRPSLAKLVEEYYDIQKEKEAKREAERKKKEEEYLATTEFRRCLVAWQDEWLNTEYYITTLHYRKEDNRCFRMKYGKPNYKELKHITTTMEEIMKQENYYEYGLGGVAWEITPEEEEKILAEYEIARKEAELAAKAEAERKAKEKAEKEAKEKAELEVKFAEAKAKGKPVEIERYIVDCDGSVDECSTDIIYRYAMPDGSIEVSRIHTH